MARIILILLAVLLVSGCGAEKIAEEKPPFVKTQRAGSAEIVSENVYAGVVKGRYETNLAFQVGGQIMSRNVNVGDSVRAGEVLMTINPRDVVQQKNQAEAQIKSTRAQLELARSNVERYRELYRQDAVAAVVLDQYETSYAAAVAAYENAKAAAVQTQNALAYTNLLADFDGVISAINAESGQIVAAGQTVATLVQTAELEVEINVPENKLSEVGIGTRAEISFWANADRLTGAVREISPMADSAARTYRVRISIPNPRDAIYLGMTAEVTFSAQENLAGAVLLPLSAIYQTGDTAQVWIVTAEKTVALKPVTVEKFSGNEVLVRGISAQDLIVTAGIHKLREGQTVRTAEAAQ
ncbi:MAG: efflux RND transporter periplasmic adaptor subunit [Selenomonadaceae bacterium]|nr:efflux RND transporter periplasmic adaptor subunit [Selenomonadaceae bacterium]